MLKDRVGWNVSTGEGFKLEYRGIDESHIAGFENVAS
jgi:hypothetical protein